VADNPRRICCSSKILHRLFEHHTKANLLLISYSNTLCELHHFAAQPTVFAAKQRNSKPSIFYATTAIIACARLIAVQLCQRRQWFTPKVPSRVVERTRGLLAQRQTHLVAQPSRRRTASTRDPPLVSLCGVVVGATSIVAVVEDSPGGPLKQLGKPHLKSAKSQGQTRLA
jgi:hypothetical protein